MSKTWVLLAVMILAANGATCRADEESKDAQDKPAATIPTEDKDAKDAAAPMDEVVPAAAKEDKKDDGKDYVIPIDSKDAPKPAAVHAPAHAVSPGICCPAPTCCRCGRGKECAQKIWNWLTYRPLSKPGCCQKCCDCHTPPLYTYFLDRCHAAGCSCSTCATSAVGCQSCGHP